MRQGIALTSELIPQHEPPKQQLLRRLHLVFTCYIRAAISSSRSLVTVVTPMERAGKTDRTGIDHGQDKNNLNGECAGEILHDLI